MLILNFTFEIQIHNFNNSNNFFINNFLSQNGSCSTKKSSRFDYSSSLAKYSSKLNFARYRGCEIRESINFFKEFDKNDFRLFWKINDQAVSSYTISKGVIIYRDLKEYDGRVRVVANMQDNPRNVSTVAP